MENIKIAQVCGLCAGCKRAIDTTVKEIEKGNSVTIFKEIVHNKNVNLQGFCKSVIKTCRIL